MMKKKLIITALAFILTLNICSPLKANADEKLTLRKLQNNYETEKAKYEENQKKINLTQSEINAKRNRITVLKNEMATISKEVETLNAEIEDYKVNIKNKIIQSKNLIEQLQITEKSDLYYDYIFNADSVSDMVYRSAVIKEIVDYNEKVVSTLNTMIEDNKKREEEIAKRKVEIDKIEDELNSQVISLGDTKEKLSEGAVSIAKQMQNIESKIKYYKSRGCKLDDVIGVDCDKASSGPVRRPTQQGYVTQNNTLYSSGYFHRGLDIGSKRGKNEKIYPVANGTIQGVEYDLNGALMVRIDHIINGKHYTSLYAHLSKFAPNLYKGKKVTSNDYIGYMGDTGYSFGVHLHIEMYDCWLYSDAKCIKWIPYTNYALQRYKSGYNVRKMIPVTSGLYNTWTTR